MNEIESETASVSLGVVRSRSVTAANSAWVFRDFTLDLRGGRLLRGSDEIPLRPKSFALLEYLVANAQRLLSREELLSAVWGRKIVTDDSLTHCIADIRRALGEAGPEVIRTVPGRGYVFEPPVRPTTKPRSDPPVPTQPEHVGLPAVAEPGRSRGWWTIRWLAAGFAVVGLAAIVWWASRDASVPETPIAEQIPRKSIAVLRFTDMSESQDQAYLADGLAEEILHVLAQAPELLVMARTSSFALEGASIATVAAKLNVAYVLEGSVRRSGDRVRVTTQLVDAVTSGHLWSKVYERDLEEIFEVETEIADAVAKALNVTLADDGEPAGAPPPNARAYEAFQRGKFFFSRRAPGDIERARGLFEQAVAIDPEFARAWVGLAAIYNIRRWGQLGEQEGFEPQAVGDDLDDRELDERARQAVERALELAPNQADAHVRASHYHRSVGNREKAIEHLERARALDPDHPLVLGSMSLQHLWGNRLDDVIAVLERAVLRDPLGAAIRHNLAERLLWAYRLDEALAEYRKVLALGRALSGGDGRVDLAALGVANVLLLQRKPQETLEWIASWPAGQDRDYALAMIYHALGQPLESDAALERLIASAGIDAHLRIAEVHAFRSEADPALTSLQRLRGHDNCRNREIIRAFYSPFLARLRGDSRWEAWRTDAARRMRECDVYRFSVPT